MNGRLAIEGLLAELQQPRDVAHVDMGKEDGAGEGGKGVLLRILGFCSDPYRGAPLAAWAPVAGGEAEADPRQKMPC